MALSGTISGSTNNQYIQARIRWSATQNQLANTSSVTAIFEVRKLSTSSAATTGEGNWTLTINGTSKSIHKTSMNVPNNDVWQELGRNTVSVPHNADGTKTISITGSGGTLRTTWTTTTVSGSVTLDAIPRQTIPTFNADPHYFGDDLEITITPALSTFTHDILYTWGNGEAVTIVSGFTSGQYDWTIPASFMNDIPNAAASSALVITVKTYSGGSLLGTTNTAITCEVPASVVPTISAITCTDTGNQVPSSWGVFVKTLSTLHVNATAAGAYGSTVTSYLIEAMDQARTQNDVDIGAITASGSVSVKVTVTDSRGRTAENTTSITVVDYDLPVIESCIVERTNNRGIPVENGTYLRVTLGCSVSSVDHHNAMTVKIYYKDASDPNVDPTLARTISEPGVIALQGRVEMISGMDVAKTYTITVEVYDSLAAASAPTVISGVIQSEGAIISWRYGGTGVAFGRTSETPYQADFEWEIRGRHGAILDVPLPVTSGGTGATSLDALIAQIVDRVYPIGCLYWSNDSTDPGDLFGGTWTPITDKFILAAGSNHTVSTSIQNPDALDGGAESDSFNTTHKHQAPIGSNGSAVGGVAINGTFNGGNGCAYRTANQSYSGTLSGNVHMWYTGDATVSATIDTMPPYVVKYCWERVA